MHFVVSLSYNSHLNNVHTSILEPQHVEQKTTEITM